ncbi:nucleotidyltransferase family protein [Actinoplanes sp. LDG1-06]|uniref:Nucleotidyltransferase family protein n=1 Tax=Paractinoplanes ovalisporus TaxID=2810368 RepID=A0ABS2AME4_9ACTN|nr:nucleotidyltransferase family protein [Actinoplanes ovalisporus]MBM2621027.1 nucleotidyltransferase family protein [Actinoplanes ovalisporus]
MGVTGLVLAAGGSLRLGEAKQLLPYRGRTLLDATLDVARACGFDQLLVTLGGSAGEIHRRVDLSGCTVVQNPGYSSGCGSSISTAMASVRESALILLLGDQPGISAATVRSLLPAPTPMAVCRYDNGLGHPFLFREPTFPELSALHGDKAVWKVLHEGPYEVTEVRVDGPVPIDVDTRDDYDRLLADS